MVYSDLHRGQRNMPDDEKRITIRVPGDLHLRVKIKAALLGKTVSDLLREYLEELASDVVLPAEVKKEERKD